MTNKYETRAANQRRRSRADELPPDQAKAYAKQLKEERIEAIAEIMRRVSNPDGSRSWCPKRRKELAKQWGENDDYLRRLAAIASKRVLDEVMHPTEMKAIAATAVMDGIADAHRNKKWKDVAALVGLVFKAHEQASQSELTVKVKLATPTDAARAVAEMFGSNAAKEISAESNEQEEGRPSESSDSAEEDPSEA